MIVVAGIFRTGLSMTMQMLHAGGYPCIGEYPAFEHYDTGKIPWLELAGKNIAVKAVDTARQFPIPGLKYDVIRLFRNYDEMAKSTVKFVSAMTPLTGIKIPPLDEKHRLKLIGSFRKDDAAMDKRFRRAGCRVCELHFEEILAHPLSFSKWVEDFIRYPDFDAQKAASVVIERGPECYDGILEMKQLGF